MNGYWLTAIVGGVAIWAVGVMWFASVFAEVTAERIDLARDSHPCNRRR